MEFQPGIVVSKKELDAHGELGRALYGAWVIWEDVEHRHLTLAGKRVLVRPLTFKCKVCGELYCEVERECAEAALPGWVMEGADGAGICSSLVRTD